MDVVFKVALAVVLLQLTPLLARLWHAACSSAPLQIFNGPASLSSTFLAAAELRVADALWLTFRELGWIGPAVLVTLASWLLRRHRAVYLLDFALFDPPMEWQVITPACRAPVLSPRPARPAAATWDQLRAQP